MKKKLLLLSVLLFCFLSEAQEKSDLGPLITDRPDATEAPNLVRKGFFQIETGSFYEEFEYGNVLEKSWTFNTTLLRYGLLDNLELRLGWDFREVTTETEGTELADVRSGFTPLLAGVKIGIADEKGLLPQIGLLGHIYLPLSAGQDYRPETTGTEFRLAFSHTLSSRSSIAYNLGAEWRDDSAEASYLYTLAYGYALTPALGAYVEVYGSLPEDSRSGHSWDAGFTYLVNNDLQLDATVGSGLNTDQEILLSAGFSYRFRN